MAETAEQAEMRALKEEVARLKKTRAAVVKALEAQSWDDVRAALAHSESSTKRVYSRRGMTDDEKKAHNRSMFSQEAYAFCERLHSDEVPVSSFHKKLDEAGYKPLHTSPKFTVRIVEQVFGDWKQAKGGARPVRNSVDNGKQWHTENDAFQKQQNPFYEHWAEFLHSKLFDEDGTKKEGVGVQTQIYDEMVEKYGSEFSNECGKSKLQEIANAMKFKAFKVFEVIPTYR